MKMPVKGQFGFGWIRTCCRFCIWEPVRDTSAVRTCTNKGGMRSFKKCPRHSSFGWAWRIRAPRCTAQMRCCQGAFARLLGHLRRRRRRNPPVLPNQVHQLVALVVLLCRRKCSAVNQEPHAEQARAALSRLRRSFHLSMGCYAAGATGRASICSCCSWFSWLWRSCHSVACTSLEMRGTGGGCGDGGAGGPGGAGGGDGGATTSVEEELLLELLLELELVAGGGGLTCRRMGPRARNAAAACRGDAPPGPRSAASAFGVQVALPTPARFRAASSSRSGASPRAEPYFTARPPRRPVPSAAAMPGTPRPGAFSLASQALRSGAHLHCDSGRLQTPSPILQGGGRLVRLGPGRGVVFPGERRARRTTHRAVRRRRGHAC